MKLLRGGKEEKKEVFINNSDIVRRGHIVSDDCKDITEMEDLEETKLLKL